MYDLNYTPTTLGVQSWREIISGGMRTNKVEYHCSRLLKSGITYTFCIPENESQEQGTLSSFIQIPLNCLWALDTCHIFKHSINTTFPEHVHFELASTHVCEGESILLSSQMSEKNFITLRHQPKAVYFLWPIWNRKPPWYKIYIIQDRLQIT
jgi:hypothetical protein